MKIGFIADIHGNFDALQAVLRFLKHEKAEKIACAGDIIGYGAQPNECVEAIRENKIQPVFGNHEAAALALIRMAFFNPVAREMVEWSRKTLSKENAGFLKTLPVSAAVEPFFHMVHSSPGEPMEFNYIRFLRQAVPEFKYFESRACVIGHTHVPVVYYFDSEKKVHGEITGHKFEMNRQSKYIINVGSVGQPRDGNPKASCGIFDTGTNIFEIVRLDYDIKAAQKKILDAKLPFEMADRLDKGL